MNARSVIIIVLVLPTLVAQARAQDPFATNIRPTAPLTPAEQQKTFHLPKGFEIKLFASEPNIAKPMNMAFDARGRLWISDSIEYPIAAKAGQGRDTIKVLEDTNGDGRADKITTFVDGLNIPIGLYPYRDGVIAYSIPNIYYFSDTDGDGRADKREVLYGPLGPPRDVHGLQNAFRRGFDGWIYICHGFSNESTIQGRDGSLITLQSGNTYRIRPDGSRVEQFTWGQVNPFGMTFTANGDIFTADCHSKPLSMLLRGGSYPSFGKPHDGLGFVQQVMGHGHGSTAISGVAYYSGTNFPKQYRGSLFVGNVMTGRVHRDSLEFDGSTVRAKEQPDLLSTDDPWFRPVDLQVGADGALYIADFYNRIIGHYEVPLDHPGRDRRRGRIWRVAYVGTAQHVIKSPQPQNLASATVEQLVQALSHESLTYRMLATDQLSDRIGGPAAKSLLLNVHNSKQAIARVHSLWALHRLRRLESKELVAATRDPDSSVRIHAMRMISESSKWSEKLGKSAVAGLRDDNALVRRAAADALGQHRDGGSIQPLLEALKRASTTNDTHLSQTCRIALRNQLRISGGMKRLRSLDLDKIDRRLLAGIVPAVRSAASASFLVDYLQRENLDPKTLVELLTHAARYVPEDRIDALIKLAKEKVPAELDLQLALLTSMHQSLQQRGSEGPTALTSWGALLAADLLESSVTSSKSWRNMSIANPWGLETRACADGRNGVVFLSSLAGGEKATAVLRSKPFTIPAQLRFFVCGHLGLPTQPASNRNFVQLRLVNSNKVLAKSLAPRSDTAQEVVWKLDKFAGQKGYLEVVDGLNLSAYAWVAVSRFEPAVVSVPDVSPILIAHRQTSAATIAQSLQLRSLKIPLSALLVDDYVAWSVRAAAARAVVSFQPDSVLDALVFLIGQQVVPSKLRTSICQLVVNRNTAQATEFLSKAMQVVSTRLQRQMAQRLATSQPGSETLIKLIEQGHASARLLQIESVKQKLLATKPLNVTERIDQITASLPPMKQEIQSLLVARRRGYSNAKQSVPRGLQLFTKHCAACHQVGGKGAIIGPQLDGIGNRGLERIMEDVLDPNRNVDAAFHTTIFSLSDGQVVSGLFRRKEGKIIIVANREGKEVSISVDKIEEQSKPKISIMPDNVG